MSKTTDLLSGSHIPILVRIMARTNGPVLEMGVGYNSTPLLHWLCMEKKRELLSLENDKGWLNKFKYYENDLHKLKFVKDWDKARIDFTHWTVALIDHRPAGRRRVEAVRLANKADYVLLHDSEPEIDRFYGYKKIYPAFKQVIQYTVVKPHTAVCSNFKDLRSL